MSLRLNYNQLLCTYRARHRVRIYVYPSFCRRQKREYRENISPAPNKHSNTIIFQLRYAYIYPSNIGRISKIDIYIKQYTLCMRTNEIECKISEKSLR